MAKLFNNIRKKLVTEKPSTARTANYLKYAIGEIVLVVIGILIALSINNWNEQRKNNLKEKSILADIHEEFLQNKKQLDTVVFYNKRSYLNCKKLVALFPIDIKKDNLDSISRYINYSLFTYTFNPSQGTIKSIVNTSSFDIIQNDSLRNILISWQDLVTDLQEDELVTKNTVIKLIDPKFSKNLDFNLNLKDKRNHLEFLETIEFEYLMHIRFDNLDGIFKKGTELDKVTYNLNKIIALTKPKE